MGWVSVIITFLVTYIAPVALAIYLYLRYTFSYWKNLGVPSTNPSTPLGDLAGVGTKYHIGEKLLMIYDELKQQGHGRFGGLYNLTRPNLMMIDLDLVKAVLVKDFNVFVNRNFFHNEKDDPLSTNTLTLEGNRWKRRRNFLSPAFTTGKLKAIFELIDKKRDDLISFMDRSSKQEFNAKDISLNFTADVVGATVFGIDCKAMESNDRTIIELADSFFGGDSKLTFVRFLFSASFPKIARVLKFTFTPPKVQNFIFDLINNAVSFRETNKHESNDLLGMLITLKNKGHLENKGSKMNLSEPFGITQIAAESSIFFFGGFETSATTMSFALFELARNLEYQEKLREEIKQSKEKYDGKITYEGLMEMQYLGQVFNETLRMYPPFSFITRLASEAYQIPNSDVVIPKGTEVWIPIFAIHRDPQHYPNPDIFNPENFSTEAVRNRSPYTFLAFSDGPRNCLGMRFAQLQTKFGLATIIDNFKLTLNSRTKPTFKIDLKSPVTLAWEGGLWLNAEKISE